MGELYRHDCQNCGYRSEVSGGGDVGFIAHTTTIECGDCKRLYDIVVGRWEPGVEGILDPQPLTCPQDSTHKAEKWSSGDPCPKCGTAIKRGTATLIWD